MSMDLLQAVTDLSQALLSAADSDDWAKVQALAGERDAMIREHAANASSEQQLTLLQDNQRLEAAIAARRQSIQKTLGEWQSGREAVAAYQKNHR